MKLKMRRGDVTTVMEMTWARGLNEGKGFGFKHVYAVLHGVRKNKDIQALHKELVALRTHKPKRR
jgi:hypothetical protein